MKTVNVIEYFSGSVQSLHAFEDTKDGNAEAEALFVRVAGENGMENGDKDACLDDGIFEDGDYQVFLVHSA